MNYLEDNFNFPMSSFPNRGVFNDFLLLLLNHLLRPNLEMFISIVGCFGLGFEGERPRRLCFQRKGVRLGRGEMIYVKALQ